TRLPPAGFLVVWADGHPERNHSGGDLHVPFKLSAGGEMIVLSAPDGTRLDLVGFGRQEQDISEGRWPDGATTPFRTLSRPTPGSANFSAPELHLTALWQTTPDALEFAWPSTVGQQFRVEYKDDLRDSTWIELVTTIVGSGPETRVTLQNGP